MEDVKVEGSEDLIVPIIQDSGHVEEKKSKKKQNKTKVTRNGYDKLDTTPEKPIKKVRVNKLGGTVVFVVSDDVKEVECVINTKNFKVEAIGGVAIVNFGRPFVDYPSILYKTK